MSGYYVKGDRVRLLDASEYEKEGLKNGDRGTVTLISNGGLHVKYDNGVEPGFQFFYRFEKIDSPPAPADLLEATVQNFEDQARLMLDKYLAATVESFRTELNKQFGLKGK